MEKLLLTEVRNNKTQSLSGSEKFGFYLFKDKLGWSGLFGRLLPCLLFGFLLFAQNSNAQGLLKSVPVYSSDEVTGIDLVNVEGTVPSRDNYNVPYPEPEFKLKSGNLTPNSAVDIRGITNQFNIFAGEVSAIDDQTITDYPFRTASVYERTQMLVLASEIGPAAKFLYNLELQRINTNTSTVSNFEVRLMHTNLSVMPASYVDMSGSTLVYSAAPFTIPAGSGAEATPNWMTINFNQVSTFGFNGTQNLIVEIIWGPRTSGSTSLTVNGKNFGATDYKVAYGYGASANPVYTGRSGVRPNMRFGYNVAAYGTVNQMLDNFIEGCATVSNVSFTGNNRQIGYFTRRTDNPNFPFAEGIVLSTGQVTDAAGPNSMGSKTTMFGGAADSDIGTNSHDAAVLTFSFVPNATQVSFRYTFASEEYAEYCASNYNDGFGFYISGPGITRQNIALLPNNNRVTINNTCSTAYLTTVAPGSQTIEFDGQTIVLTASMSGLQACGVYTMKLVIADVYDEKWDSGVFLEAGSFGEESEFDFDNLNYKSNPTFDVFRNCNPNTLRVTRNSTDLSAAVPVVITIGGTATAANHNLVSQTVTIPAGASSVDVPYVLYDNPVPGGSATITVTAKNGCPCDPFDFTRTINLSDTYAFAQGSPSVTNAQSCTSPNGVININLNVLAAQSLFSFTYVLKDRDGNQLDSFSGPDPSYAFTGLAAGTYIIEVYDDKSCKRLTANNIVVNAPGLPTVTCPGNSSVCINNGNVTLGGASPAGGTYSGPGVTAGIFNPVTAGVGTHQINYIYTDNNSGCTNNCFFFITVTALPAPPEVSVVQPTCTVATGTVTVTSATAGLTFSFDGAAYAAYPAGGYTLVAPGQHTLIAKNAAGCISSTVNITVNQQPALPAAPSVGVVNNCGSSTLTASGYTGTLLWSTGETTASIVVTLPGSYTVTQTVGGCTSTPGSGTAAPKAIPAAPSVGVVNNCGSSILTASGYTGTLLWSTGATTASIEVTSSGTYSVTQTVVGCISNPGSGTAAPKTIPAAPSVGVVNNCGSSTLTASGYTGTLLWSTGATTASIEVTTSGSYTVTQTVGGCTSTPGSGTAAPKEIPAAPSVGVVNNCGSSILTASGYTGTLLWSTGATTASIEVTTSGSYTVTQTVGGCTSNPGSGIAAPKAVPAAPVVGTITQPACAVTTGSVVLSGLPAGNWTINPGEITGSTVSTTIANLAPGTYNYAVTNSAGCTSQASANVVINPQPDITSNITVSPNIIQGVMGFTTLVKVTELNQVNTAGLITILITKDTHWTFDGAYNPALTMIGTTPVNNGLWSYSATANPDYHTFTTTAVIPAGTFVTFGFQAIFDPANTKGIATITSQIVSCSGGENRLNNNADSEKLEYFVN